jgi:hypothetical protein
MVRSGAASVGEQLVTFVFGPPVMAALIWSLSRGWAHTVQGEVVSDRTKRRQKIEFWTVLALMYLFVIGLALFEWLT